MTQSRVKPDDGSSERTSTSLLRGARHDAPDAWTRLVELYGRLVYHWCRRAGLQSADAADVTQETLRAVARGLKEYRHGEPGQSFRGWLYRITQNKICDLHRRNQRTVGHGVGGREEEDWCWSVIDEHSASSLASPGGSLTARLAAVEKGFSPRNWSIFWRLVVDGQDTAEVAQEFGVSHNVVRLVKARVGKRLKVLLCDRQVP